MQSASRGDQDSRLPSNAGTMAHLDPPTPCHSHTPFRRQASAHASESLRPDRHPGPPTCAHLREVPVGDAFWRVCEPRDIHVRFLDDFVVRPSFFFVTGPLAATQSELEDMVIVSEFPRIRSITTTCYAPRGGEVPNSKLGSCAWDVPPFSLRRKVRQKRWEADSPCTRVDRITLVGEFRRRRKSANMPVQSAEYSTESTILSEEKSFQV